MKELNSNFTNHVLKGLLVFAAIVAVVGFTVDVANTLKYGGVDLRYKVVGARLLIDGINPYYFKWNEGMSDLFLDPHDDPSWLVSRVTVPPTVLVLHAITAKLSYFNQRIAWLVLQWALFLSTLAIFVRSANSRFKASLILIIGLVFFSGAGFWRFHVERGQIYVLYGFLIACAYWLAQQSFRYSHILSGFLIGVTASLRPPIILMIIPMLIYKQWNLFIGSLIGVASGVLVSFTLADISIWKSYFSSVKIYEKVHSGLIKTFTPQNGYVNDIYVNRKIEGMSNLSNFLAMPAPDTSFQSLFQKLAGIIISPNILTVLLCITLLGMSFWIYKARRPSNPINLLFLSGTVMYLLSEYFLPAPRSIYNDVQWIVCLAIIIISSGIADFLSNRLNILLLISLFFSLGFLWLQKSILIGDLTMLLYTVLMLLFLAKRNNRSTEFYEERLPELQGERL
jgi:hypothetical protein